MDIRITDPTEPQAQVLLRASHALMRSLFPIETNHFLDTAGLRAPEITFLAAYEGDTLLGCAALADRGNYGEVKSMFVDPAARGKGVAQALLEALQDRASELGRQVMRLETGVGLDAAHRLYQRFGFVPSGPFGSYVASPYSLFFEKRLDQ